MTTIEIGLLFTLFLVGVGCIIAAISEDGVKIKDLQIGAVKSLPRQIVLGVFGFLILIVSVIAGSSVLRTGELQKEGDQTQKPASKTSDPEAQAASSVAPAPRPEPRKVVRPSPNGEAIQKKKREEPMSSPSSTPTPSVVNNAPGGFAVSGGTLLNPVVVNPVVGPPPLQVFVSKPSVRSQEPGKVIQDITISTNTSWEPVTFSLTCDVDIMDVQPVGTLFEFTEHYSWPIQIRWTSPPIAPRSPKTLEITSSTPIGRCSVSPQ